MDDVAKIADGLSEAQRKAVLSAAQMSFGSKADRWVCKDAMRVAAKLEQKGLAHLAVPAFAWRSSRRDVCLTPLGLAVRAHLAAQPEGE